MEENWEARCHTFTVELLAKRDWTLVQDIEAFSAEVSEEARKRFTRNRPFEDAVRLAVISCYSVLLYEMCLGTDRKLQRRAFEELSRHLDVAANFRGQPPDLVPEFRNTALRKIFEKLSSVDDPGAFFDWCNTVLLNVIRDYYRKPTTWELSLSGLLNDEEPEEELEKRVLDLRIVESGFQEPERDELHQEVIAALSACLENEPQRQIIIELFFNEKSLLQVATELNLTPNHVSVLKFRALKVLRECDDFNRLYQDWLT